ncbi:MAG: hypothetical protein JSS81_10705 [Acidobacteria bacterium]|nr:hypothetical protein [Acidobacteriota bacterium]
MEEQDRETVNLGANGSRNAGRENGKVNEDRAGTPENPANSDAATNSARSSNAEKTRKKPGSPNVNTANRANTAGSPPFAAPAAVPDLLTPALVGAAILVVLALAAALAKRLFERRKYGRNALGNLRGLKRAVRAQNELAEKWLKKRRSGNIHAIGVGKIDATDDFCIQVFVEDARRDMLDDPPTRLLPAEYRSLPIVVYEMPRADFLSLGLDERAAETTLDPRRPHEILCGGLSGGNVNLAGEAGTIGYFFRPNLLDSAAHVFLKKHVYLLSNAHVFADLRRAAKDETDLVVQPAPGETQSLRAVAGLYDYAPIRFDGDVENPNFIDAAIARIFGGQSYRPEIPRIGKIADHLPKESVELRAECRKFGRTTGYTEGRVFSIHLSIWVKYSARGEAFFKDQFLILPARGGSFVRHGDSGSLLVDRENRALGLLFAGAGAKTVLQFADVEQALDLENIVIGQTPKIENYGVANAISDVMKHFRIKPV